MAIKLTHEEFIKKIETKYNNEFVVVGEYKNSRTKIKIKHIKCGNVFEREPKRFLRTRLCPICESSFDNKGFLKRARKIHGNQFEYLEDYINSNTPIKIRHRKCGFVFHRRPSKHLLGQKCPYCLGKIITNDIFIEKANKKHKNEYEYLSEYIKSNIRISIRHKKCGTIFSQLPASHLSGIGCPVCGIIRRRMTNDEFVKKAKKIHNDEFEYLEKYVNGKTPILVIGNCQENLVGLPRG